VIKRILIGGASVMLLVVIVFLIVVSLQPNSYSVERSQTIKAKPETVFPLVNDFQLWDKWSPCFELDPQAKITISEPSGGKGARIEWDGNSSVGAGKMIVTDSQPHERVLMEQSFTRPFQDKCNVIFLLEPSGGETKITWRFQGDHGGFFEKAMCTVMNMDRMLGPMLEKGLVRLKTEAERRAAAE